MVVKGGHVPGADAVDVVFDRAAGAATSCGRPGSTPANNHGTGCTFAAATAAMLARGAPVLEALEAAKAHVHAALVASARWQLGAGHGPVSHLCRDARVPG